MTKQTKAVWGWVLYDWANSAFATTVMAGFFPVFFKSYWSYGSDVNTSTAQLGLGNSLASLLVALMAPVLGAVADKGTTRKRLLVGFAYLGVLMTASLFWVGRGQWAWAVFVYAMGVIGFAGANVFYDSLLPGVAKEDRIDYVSGLGFSMGYLGGGLLFLINVFMVLKPALFGLEDSAQAVRYAFLSVAAWWGLFSLFTVFWVPEEPLPGTPRRARGYVKAGFRQLLHTLKRLPNQKTIALFLISYWFYIDGVDTVIRMAVDYGITLGFDSNDLIVALLVTQFVGFPSALAFGKLGQVWSVRKAIFLALFVYMFVTAFGVFMTSKVEFYVLAVLIGLVQGGVQALSRSFYSRLIPKDKCAEYYGFYNMLGKFAAILGPALIGVVGLTARRMLMPPHPSAEQIRSVGILASRWGIASVLILFIVGATLFAFVDEDRGRREAAELTDVEPPAPGEPV